MISELECTRILNAGEVKYSAEEVKQMRDLMVALATIEYENYKNEQTNKTIDYECNMLQKSEYKTAS